MKKKLLIMLLILFSLTGCGKKDAKTTVDDFASKVNSTKAYTLKGNMEIYGDEEVFTYSIEANFLEKDFYKVRMINQTNNHEQVILRNKDAVYVITPSLNKSFKFQSDWPDNSSQSYLLKSIANDLKNDEERTLEEVEDNYVVKSKVNYPNNQELSYQKVTFTKDGNIKKNEIFNDKDELKIKVLFSSIDYKANLKESDFRIEDFKKKEKEEIDKEKCESEGNCKTSQSKCEGERCNQTTGAIENILYPLYIPSNTYLKSSDKVSIENGNRVILTFAGEKNFVLVEETASISPDFEIIPVYGDPLIIDDTIGAMGANSLSWTKDDISYYLAGNDLTDEELLNIGKSIGYNTKSVAKEK